MKKFILSIDQGTTGTTSLLIDSENYQIISKASKEYPQIFPQSGYVEHNLNDIWSTVEETVKDVINKAKIKSDQILSIGITNQRETTCAFRKNGEPIHNAIVWQDRRTTEFCLSKSQQYEPYKKRTGLPLDPYFSGTKMRWLLKNSKDVQIALKENDCLFGTIDTFLLYKLTNGSSHLTEASNASRTLLMNLKTCDWDDELLAFFEVPRETLPKIKDSFSHFGKTQSLNFLPDDISISCILGDQQAALFGQAGHKEGDLKCTYGTGAFILMNTGNKIKLSENGLLTTVAFKHQGKPCYAIEGSSYIAGAAVQWLRDNLKIIKKSSDIEALARKADKSQIENVLFLPFFTGIASPYWKPEAKAALVGLSRNNNESDIALACLEGITLAVNDCLVAMKEDTQINIPSVTVDGGAVVNELLMQIQSNFSETVIKRPSVIETTAYGVALGALLTIDKIKMDDLKNVWSLDKDFSPENDLIYYKTKSKKWVKMIQKLYL